MKTNRCVRRYLRKLRSSLLVSHRVKKALMKGFSSELEEYAEAHPQTDWTQLAENFGEPNEIAQILLDNAGVCENAAIRKWKRWIFLFIGVLISILLVYLCVRVTKMQREADGVAVETIRIYNVRETEDTEDTDDH